MLGKCFPPWTVTRSAWAVAQERGVSGIDVMLFSQHGTRLVHWYRVFTDNKQHQLLWFFFHDKAYCLHPPGLGRGLLGDQTQLGLRHTQKNDTSKISDTSRPCTSYADHAPPVRKAARAVATVMLPADAPALDYHALMAPAVNLSFLGQPWPSLKVSLLLPQSSVSAPDPAQSPADEFATQHYPSLPGSRTSTPPTSHCSPPRWVLLLRFPRLGRQ